MPSVTGYATEEQKEKIKQLVEEGKYEDSSAFIQFAVDYTLYNKHNME